MNEPQKADGEKESAEMQWPSVLRIGSIEDFQQSLAVAQLAFQLWQESKTSNVKLIEKASPKDFLGHAWELIEGAYACVVRPQSNKEYLAFEGGSDEAMEKVVDRILQEPVPFKKLFDPKRDKGAVGIIELHDVVTGKPIEVEWKVYRGKGGERAFYNLFLAYWRGIREERKKEFSLNPERYDKQRIEADLADVRSQIKTREDVLAGASADERKQLKKELQVLGEKRMELERRKYHVDLVNNDNAWKQGGQKVLDSWKTNGVPPNTFLALSRCRKARDNRAANLTKKPKRKRRLRTVKSWKH